MELEKGYYFHIYNQGNNSQKIFYKKENYLFFLKKMKEYILPYASFLSWCLMPNHFHWVIYVHNEVVDITPSHAMTKSHSMTNPKQQNDKSHAMTQSHSMTSHKQKIKSSTQSHTMAQSHSMTGSSKQRTINYSIGILLRTYTRAIQKQEKLSGSLFKQHTKAKPLIDEIKIEPAYWDTAFGTQINIAEGKSYLETTIEYIHQNPVYAGLVTKAEEWEFSSYKDFIGISKDQLIDYKLLESEKLLPYQSGHPTFGQSHAMTQSHSMTSRKQKNKSSIQSHTMAQSHSMTKLK